MKKNVLLLALTMSANILFAQVKFEKAKILVKEIESTICHPAAVDINKDGIMDLAVGIFDHGAKDNFIQMHLSKGSKSNPKVSQRFEYLKTAKGKKVTVQTW